MENKTIVKGVAVGVGVAAIIAGTYFLYGSKNATKNRKIVKAWTLKAKGEILEQLENLSEINEEIYHKIINEVSDKYRVLKTIDKNDVMEFIKELKSHWKNIEKAVKSSRKSNLVKKILR